MHCTNSLKIIPSIHGLLLEILSNLVLKHLSYSVYKRTAEDKHLAPLAEMISRTLFVDVTSCG